MDDLKWSKVSAAIQEESEARSALNLLIMRLHTERNEYRRINDRLVDEADTADERIRYLEECVRERDEAATAGLGTMDYCGYCGQEGPGHPNMCYTDRTHRTPCPTQTHPLKEKS